MKELEEKIKDLEKTLELAFENKGICQFCNKEGAELTTDPYAHEVYDETIYLYACDKCTDEMAEEI